MDSEALDAFKVESALREVERFAVLLPPSHVPLPWLRELATEVYPEFAASPQALDLLVESLDDNGLLRREGEVAEVAQADERRAEPLRSAMVPSEAVALKKRLREFCDRKLAASRLAVEQLVNRVMTGDPMTAATAWTVPPIEVVRERAASDDRVVIVDYGDGTYSVRVKEAPAWEDASLRALALQEFLSEDLAGIAWSLSTQLLPARVLQESEERVGERHLREPENPQAAMMAGLYWLRLAHQSYGEGGGCGASWNCAGKAVEILERVRDLRPDDPETATLLAEAVKARWAYDD